MRFSAECAFPHLGKRGAGSRKSTLCSCDVTEKRILARTHRARLTEKCTLQPASHGKAQSGPRPQSTPHGKAHFGRAPGAHLTKRRTLPNRWGSECAFRLRRHPRGAGRNPPPACGALWRMPQLGKRARATPRQPAGGLRQGPQASAWGLAARRGAVWAEGLADGAPRARSGHHQAASCGLRRCRELRISPTS